MFAVKIRLINYIPGQYDSWARVVVVVTNPTNADISVPVGFNNNVGSDSDTVYLAYNPRYVVMYVIILYFI